MTIAFSRLPLPRHFRIEREEYADGARAIRFHLGWGRLVKFSWEADRG